MNDNEYIDRLRKDFRGITELISQEYLRHPTKQKKRMSAAEWERYQQIEAQRLRWIEELKTQAVEHFGLSSELATAVWELIAIGAADTEES